MAETITPEAVENTVREALAQFGPEPDEIKLEATFEELDVDSLDLAELSQIIEDEYGVQLKGDDVAKIKTVAAEVARRGVTVNAVAPGFIETEMTKDIPDAVIEAIPARRVGAPEDVAAAVRFLASDDAAYVTGTTLFVDGGMSA